MSDSPTSLPPKKEVALALLEGPSVFIHLDPRKPGVIVPKWFSAQPQLVLQVGLNMAIPIPDLVVDDECISCTLSFNRAGVWCKMPWTAIYALVGEDGRGMMWPADVPPEVVLSQQKQATVKPIKKQKPKLRAVTSDESHQPEEPTTPSIPEPTPTPWPTAAGAERSTMSDTPNNVRPFTRPTSTKKAKRVLPPYLRVIK